MSIATFLDTNNLEANTLVVQVIKQINPCSFIVGDSSRLALLDIKENPHHEKDIKVGSSVKLLKPLAKDNQTIQTNRKFKPMQTKEVLRLTPSEEDISKLISTTEDIKPKHELITFQSFITNQSQSIIPIITVLVTNVSRIIETKMGK